MTAWRRDLHAHPETAYEEFRTADKVAAILQELGLEVTRGLGGTGLVATLNGALGEGDAIALRADMDALHLQELNSFAHRSQLDGKMHACGHDGHTAILLGAATALAANPEFAGKVHFIFQPAEENEAGARAMIEDGLFERFPVKAVFGLHNWPGLPAGEVAVHEGPVMAAFDTFDIRIRGEGCHGGMPHLGSDPVQAAGQLICALQSIVSRNLDPQKAGVVSVTQIEGGHTYNVLPEEVVLRGTTRSFCPEVRDQIEQRMRQLAESICAGLGCHAELCYSRRYPATINSEAEARQCLATLQELPGVGKVHLNPPASMGGEDFAFMLEQHPGCYIWLGGGSDEHCHGLHSPHYDFNDSTLPLGANYWIGLVHRLLGR
ncbi:M20 aminoacylase family protein [Marinobacterium arenosum]|uniref:M20 aminoacylase family protein n=1 Tax=Marinobacterium arenosum TaxID=2862496 RepID=UPI001C97219D|nr:M20 aminoacylase family protein [Marinobacterium arenosum]MBY4677002.1 amidohydrolase [Marinobacterium arenosum]